MVNFASLRCHETEEAQPDLSARKPARAQVRRQTKVSFLQTALYAVEGALQAQGRVSSKLAVSMPLNGLFGHRWSDEEIPGHILAGWSSRPFA